MADIQPPMTEQEQSEASMPNINLLYSSPKLIDFLSTDYGNMDSAHSYGMTALQEITKAVFNRDWWKMICIIWMCVNTLVSIGAVIFSAFDIDSDDDTNEFIRDIALLIAGISGFMMGSVYILSEFPYYVKQLQNSDYVRATPAHKMVAGCFTLFNFVFAVSIVTTFVTNWMVYDDDEDDTSDVTYFAIFYTLTIPIVLGVYLIFWIGLVGLLGVVMMPTILYMIDSCCEPLCSKMCANSDENVKGDVVLEMEPVINVEPTTTDIEETTVETTVDEDTNVEETNVDIDDDTKVEETTDDVTDKVEESTEPVLEPTDDTKIEVVETSEITPADTTDSVA